MGFHETRFPVGVSLGSSGGPGFASAVTELRSGAVEVQRHRERPVRVFDALANNRKPARYAQIRDFFVARDGAANGFRFKDWSDFTTSATKIGAPSATDVQIGVGDGVTTGFRLATKYVDGGVTRMRPIMKPVAGTVLVALGGVAQASGWSVDTTTGIVTFSTAPTAGTAVQAGCEFDVPVRFAPDTDRELRAQWQANSIKTVERIMLVEDISDVAFDDERHFGGSSDLGELSANVSVSLLTGAVLRCAPAGAARTLTLPAASFLGVGGGPFFRLFNDSPTYGLVVKDGATTIVTIAAGGSAELWLCAADALGTLRWRATA